MLFIKHLANDIHVLSKLQSVYKYVVVKVKEFICHYTHVTVFSGELGVWGMHIVNNIQLILEPSAVYK